MIVWTTCSGGLSFILKLDGKVDAVTMFFLTV